jgi:hypothetical protein
MNSRQGWPLYHFCLYGDKSLVEALLNHIPEGPLPKSGCPLVVPLNLFAHSMQYWEVRAGSNALAVTIHMDVIRLLVLQLLEETDPLRTTNNT